MSARGRRARCTRTVSSCRSAVPWVDETVTNAPASRARRSIAAATIPIEGVVRSSPTTAIESFARRIARAEASAV